MPAMMRLLAIVLLFAAPGLAHAGRTFGLVIGVNNYTYVPTLDGARNDALDITQALNRSGAARVITLLDQDATKINVTGSWRSLISEAKPGDVVFLSYAGHGAQAPQRNSGEEKDGLDEFWVLPGFNPRNIRETWRETVFDNELSQWFTEASNRGVRVVLIADSCHAGGMERAVNGKLRFVDLGKSRLLGELFARLMKDGEPAPQTEQSVLPANVTMLAATPEALPVPEVVINGQARGALSWSVARAIEGLADRNQDGIITRNETEDYVLATVRMRSESLQTPVFTPLAARSADEILLAVQPRESTELANEAVGQSSSRPQPMARELGFKPVLPILVTGADIQPEDTVAGAFPYQWDARKGIFITPNGDVAAEHISAYTVNDVVSKFILLDFLKAVASRNPGKTRITPEKSLYRAGERIKFDALRGRYRNMLVFNLANTGEVQFLDMVIDGEASNKTFLKEMQVVAPFGSDHLVTVTSNEPLEAIGRAMARGVTPKELLQSLSTRIDGTDTAVAVTPIYTRKN
ncbi:MAG: caspase domain protein [Rhizobium sp.]|nr:caspase domain protein [Rhizobium sp.]